MEETRLLEELGMLRTALDNINATLKDISEKLDGLVLVEEYVDEDEDFECEEGDEDSHGPD